MLKKYIMMLLYMLACLNVHASSTEPLIFLGDSNLPPYEYLKNGKPTGANIDLAHAIGQVLKRPVEIRLMKWSDAQARLLAGEGHALTFLGRTPEREPQFDFSIETIPANFALFIHSDTARQFTHETMAGMRIGVTKGGLASSYFKTTYPNASLIEVEDGIDGIRKLVRHDIDGLAANEWTQLHLLKELGISGITRLPPFIERKGNVAVRKGDAATLTQIDEALAELKKNGRFDQIIDNWSQSRVYLIPDFTIRMFLLFFGMLSLSCVLLVIAFIWVRKQKQRLAFEVANREQIEHALRQSQHELDIALDSGKIGMYYWDLLTGKLKWTEHHYTIMGYAKADFEPTYQTFRERIHHEDIDSLESSVKNAIANRKDHLATFRVITLDGKIRFVSGRGRCIYAPDGTAVQMIGAIIDVTYIKEADIALAKRDRELANIVSNSPDIFARFDLQLRHLYISPVIEQFTGIKPSDFIGKTHEELGQPAELCVAWRSRMAEAIATRQIQHINISFATPTGNRRIYNTRVIPELDKNGSVETLLTIGTDVTERENALQALKLSEEKLQKIDRHKDEFLATLAHELRNPLTAIKTGLDLMRLASGNQDTVTRVRSMLERQTNQMAYLIDDLMDISRINSGKVELKKIKLDVKSVISTAIETSLPHIEAARHELAVEMTEDVLRIDADPTRLVQVLSNILTNSAKYTPSGGRIVISVQREMSEVVISITDNGIGISAQELPLVFDMFSQIGSNTVQSQGGLGIGLAIVRRLVEMHGGRVTATSPGPDKGSTFSIRLPLSEHEMENSAEVAIHTDAAEKPSGQPCQTLIADDN